MVRSAWLVKLIDFLLIAAGFAAAQAAYDYFFPANYASVSPGQRIGGGLLSAVTLWAVIRTYDQTGPEDFRSLFDQFCIGAGIILILQAVLNYFHVLIRSFFLIVIGAMIASALLACARRWLYAREKGPARGTVIIGSNPLMLQLARGLAQPLLGVIASPSADSAVGERTLDDADPIESIASGRRVSHILVAADDIPGAFSPALLNSLLIHSRMGARIMDISGLYEKLYQRIYAPGLRPGALLLSPSLRADSRAMAIQAIYTNLFGLFFLLVLSPVMLLVAAAVALFSDRGPALEAVECVGFHNIPFFRLRFRVFRTDGSGRPTAIGALISRLHLDELPQLINIVRGEMALFGPRPIRAEFAARMTELMPFYALRFSVKPGLLGWAQVHLPGRQPPQCELEWLEYDLYYIKEGSIWLDVSIVMMKLLGGAESAPYWADSRGPVSPLPPLLR
jgi:lipopolysaccharide/colanic/teichoic acid biosynthesis glycosyltransferase